MKVRAGGGGGQPLGPLEIKAPLTLVGVPARISEGDPLGRYRGTIVNVTDGRPIGRNSHHWGRRRRPERTRDQLVPVTPATDGPPDTVVPKFGQGDAAG